MAPDYGLRKKFRMGGETPVGLEDLTVSEKNENASPYGSGYKTKLHGYGSSPKEITGKST